MTTAQVELVDAFTDTPGQGNRAGVVLDAAGLSPAAMQALAAQSGAAETAFGIRPAQPADYDLEVRYFSPTREIPICGHATIAFHYLRAQRLGLAGQTVRAKTGAGVLPVAIERDGADLRVVMTQAAPQLLDTPGPAQTARVLAALGLADGDLEPGLPIQVITTGHAKVLVPIRSYARLGALRPDRERLLALSPLAGANGFFVFTLDRQREDLLYHGRMFSPAVGVDEDAVTGNANGPAGYYLFAHGRLGGPARGLVRYQAAQGEALGRAGLIEVRLHVDGGRVELVQVAGRAVVVPPRPA